MQFPQSSSTSNSHKMACSHHFISFSVFGVSISINCLFVRAQNAIYTKLLEMLYLRCLQAFSDNLQSCHFPVYHSINSYIFLSKFSNFLVIISLENRLSKNQIIFIIRLFLILFSIILSYYAIFAILFISSILHQLIPDAYILLNDMFNAPSAENNKFPFLSKYLLFPSTIRSALGEFRFLLFSESIPLRPQS